MFDDRLTKLREEIGLNKKEVAKALNMPYTTYLNYENNEREPNSETLIQIANFFNVSIDFLLGVSDVKTTDINIQNIRNATGLSEMAITNIKRFCVDEPIGMVYLNKLLEDLIYSNSKSILYEIILYLHLHNAGHKQCNDYFALLSNNRIDRISYKTPKLPFELQRISENEIIEKILLDNIIENLKLKTINEETSMPVCRTK